MATTSRKDSLTYAIVGTGAVGGLYGACLQKAGHTVHFLAHSDAEYIAQHGLEVESPWGDISLPQVHVYSRTNDMPACDVVCVCLKSTMNHLLPRLLPPLLHPGTVILLMQNGLGAEEEMAALFPSALVAGGLCYVASNKAGPGHIRHIGEGNVLLGAHSNGMQDLINRIRSDFTAAGVPCTVDPSLFDARWRKLVWNIPYNGLSVVLNVETDRIMAHPSSRALVADIMKEVVLGNHACGGTIEEGYIAELMAVTDRLKPYSPSMKLDYEAARPLEVEYIHRRPVAAARAAGFEMARVEALAAELEFLDAQRRGEFAADRKTLNN
ncbi:putative 2-dehydropantoate 2-reductase [bacterium]|nr:putative 2-dehydropantoate 2-reductase [bacterium]